MNNLIAHWPAPTHIRALTTSRAIGHSVAPYQSNNLALHVGDNAATVLANREQLKQNLQLPKEPIWLEQTHSNRCIIVEEDSNRDVDAAITRQMNTPLAIMTADCLPILLCDQQGQEIAAIHAGWRGLMHGIIENTLTKMQNPSNHLLAWIGPAICQTCYEVGPEVQQAFTNHLPAAEIAFRPQGDRFYADLAKIAELILTAAGVCAIYHSHACTYESVDQFYSYRRSAQTGRMATLIWMNVG